MTFTARLNIALAILARAGIRPIVYAPPTHRLLWRLGCRIRPPHFAGELANLLVVWLVATPLMLLLLMFRQSPLDALFDGAQLAFYVALSVALWFKKVAEDHGLPAWSELESPDQPFRSTASPSPSSTLGLRD